MSYLNLFLLFWIFIIGYVVYRIINHNNNPWFVINILKVNNIPGPRSYPLIGNLLDILVPSDQLWVSLRNWSKQYYPIYKLWSGPYVAIALLCPDDIEIILSSTKHIKKSNLYLLLKSWLGNGLLTSTGRRWRSRRKILTSAFHFNILQQFFGTFTARTILLTERLQDECDKNSSNIVPIVTDFTLRSISETAMGTRLDEDKELYETYIKSIYRMGELVVHQILRPWFYFNTTYKFTPEYDEKKKLTTFLHDFSMNVIQQRRESLECPDYSLNNSNFESGIKKHLAMLDLLISAQKSGANIDDNGIREEVDTFMFEGHDTLAMSLCFTLMLLANHNDVQLRVVEELNQILEYTNRSITYQDLQSMTYLEMVIKESLRLYPSVPLIARVADEDIYTTTGYIVPKQTFVHIYIYDVHRNPEIYPEPDKFNPDRFLPENVLTRHPFAYLPFSAGPRNCIGQKFAMMEMKIVLSNIVRKFILLPIDTPESLVLMTDLIIRPKYGVKLKFMPRNITPLNEQLFTN